MNSRDHGIQADKQQVHGKAESMEHVIPMRTRVLEQQMETGSTPAGIVCRADLPRRLIVKVASNVRQALRVLSHMRWGLITCGCAWHKQRLAHWALLLSDGGTQPNTSMHTLNNHSRQCAWHTAQTQVNVSAHSHALACTVAHLLQHTLTCTQCSVC